MSDFNYKLLVPLRIEGENSRLPKTLFTSIGAYPLAASNKVACNIFSGAQTSQKRRNWLLPRSPIPIGVLDSNEVAINRRMVVAANQLF